MQAAIWWERPVPTCCESWAFPVGRVSKPALPASPWVAGKRGQARKHVWKLGEPCVRNGLSTPGEHGHQPAPKSLICSRLSHFPILTRGRSGGNIVHAKGRASVRKEPASAAFAWSTVCIKWEAGAPLEIGCQQLAPQANLAVSAPKPSLPPPPPAGFLQAMGSNRIRLWHPT